MITKYLIEKSMGLLKQVPEYRDDNRGFTAFNDGSCECEVGELLYSLVRVFKPRTVLETGTYKGVSSSYMALAMEENQTGILDTCEINQEHISTSKQLWGVLGISHRIHEHHLPSSQFSPQYNYDIMFLDSEPDLRFGELVKFYEFLTPGGVALIHDLPRSMCQGNFNPDHPEKKSWPFGDLPTFLREKIKSGELSVTHFPNPRGMVSFYKAKEDDYRPS